MDIDESALFSFVQPMIFKNSEIQFPKVFLSSALTAPSQSANLRKSCVFIGAGSGCSVFLSFLEEADLEKEQHFIFIIREVSQLSWFSGALNKLIEKESPLLK